MPDYVAVPHAAYNWMIAVYFFFGFRHGFIVVKLYFGLRFYFRTKKIGSNQQLILITPLLACHVI